MDYDEETKKKLEFQRFVEQKQEEERAAAYHENLKRGNRKTRRTLDAKQRKKTGEK